MYKKVELPQGFVGMEKEIANLWNARNVIKKNFDMNQDGEYFTFYDGPPTANGKPHIGHILTRVMKDIIPRYKVMKGYKVIRKAGWDTHGLHIKDLYPTFVLMPTKLIQYMDCDKLHMDFPCQPNSQFD